MSIDEQQQFDDEVRRIREQHWPVCLKILEEATKKMHGELEKTVTKDEAYNLIMVLLLRDVFFRKTVPIAAGRDDDDILDWIAQEYDDWEEESRP